MLYFKLLISYLSIFYCDKDILKFDIDTVLSVNNISNLIDIAICCIKFYKLFSSQNFNSV